MEARTRLGLGGQAELLTRAVGSGDSKAAANKRSNLEWDLNDWKWDEDLFLATPLINSSSTTSPLINYHPQQSTHFFPLETGGVNNHYHHRDVAAGSSSSTSSSCSDEFKNLGGGVGAGSRRELDKRRRVLVVRDDNLEDEAAPASLALKLNSRGGRDCYTPECERDASGKKTKAAATAASRAVCQVEDCKADLTKAKDYHRRHKVCEMHSKASRALVANVMQRFCQQCSRFHALQEFDEGKRSCRRRLTGHNKRRRKTQPDPMANETSSNDSQASGYLLMCIVKILSHIHSGKTNQTDDQELLSHLLRSLGGHGALHGDKDISRLLQLPQNFPNNGAEMVSALLANGTQGLPISKHPEMSQNILHNRDVQVEDLPTSSSQPTQSSVAYVQVNENHVERNKLNNFDLNDAYIDLEAAIEDLERSPVPVDVAPSNLEYHSWMRQNSHQSSPPQTSGNSDSASAPSPSSSSADARSRTDRIVFKLFGKQPSDFPGSLRGQILDWLSHSPTDIESYIRPGCIVLTIYLCTSVLAWEELSHNLGSSLSRLLNVSDDGSFWRTGWIYARVQNRIVFICSRIVVETSLPSQSSYYGAIVSVKPIAVPPSERAEFTITGVNLSRPSTRILGALRGTYVLFEDNGQSLERIDSFKEHDELQCLNFACSIPVVTGRGFLELEDLGLSSSFFPFIVAEKDVCSEIRMLESEMELPETDCLGVKTESRKLAMDFIHEFGWLLHRSQLKSKLGHSDQNSHPFAFTRFKWIIQFSADHGWCAVVKKLLDLLLDGNIGAREQLLLSSAMFEMGLLHRAVRRNSRPLVELLLRYVPERIANELSLEYASLVGSEGSPLFRPDAVGPAGLTPLHVAAGTDGSEDVLNALTNDPGQVAVEAWKNARDNNGFTPEDYARLRGHYSYVHLVRRKIHKKILVGHVAVVDISNAVSSGWTKQNEGEEARKTSFEIARSEIGSAGLHRCRLCDRKFVATGGGNGSPLYRPGMLSMVAIAAVCVCVALLFKSSPEVLFVFRPFRWEMLDYGSW
ncbi:unnamed protein product [Coffea canephora]|uniref:SBP-type domain-containing protein n=1 Tax=Coffea canephora TaxID=49390 RepID=A0A068V8Q1_COFCA|nr:unnamed protein product [Coffea canephora]